MPPPWGPPGGGGPGGFGCLGDLCSVLISCAAAACLRAAVDQCSAAALADQVALAVAPLVGEHYPLATFQACRSRCSCSFYL
ncbi:hypothetical protein C1H46_043821 [Malus baccata]|uniref:Secreted protein n=2 Tax=Malus TaxID=3749 RepID=A0A498K332_MALDO|nr:hypothetical protein DVH24_015280 [Malus domestica]TQD70651.1 hypothetical protein C1H46_043821 [Malus baccata]